MPSKFIALGNQKGRKNPSKQAIEKWTSDINFIVSTLNVIDMDNLRNRILLKVLPLKV